VTRNGRNFTFFKFRTMHADARERFPEHYRFTQGPGSEDVFYKLVDDPRNTRIGRWLRRTTLDELPNLLNVLKGDISLVGPRPDLPELVRFYTDLELSCLLTKAGLTGSAQTRGRSLLTMKERLRFDLYYVSHQSTWLDIKLMLKTVLVVLLRRGAF
jgi:lipopolysaccharide/colanic/teichoic acid biosynthesis glycosyltransferase